MKMLRRTSFKCLTRLVALHLCVLTGWVLVTAQNAAETLKLELLNGHSGGNVLAIAVSRDGKYALTGSSDQTAILWEVATGRQLRRFAGHVDQVSSVAFTGDARYVLTASYDKSTRLWETATGKQVRVFVENRNGVLIGHSGKILSMAISADGRLVATAGEDKTARIWDLNTGKQLFLLQHSDTVNSIAFSPDSKALLTGGVDRIARLYSTLDGTLVRQYAGHSHEISSVAFSPDGAFIVTGSDPASPGDGPYDDPVRLWNTTKGSEIKRFTVKSGVLSVSFTPNGKSILVVNDLGRIEDTELAHILEIASGRETWHSDESFQTAVFMPDGVDLLYVKPDFDNVVHRVDTKNNTLGRELTGLSSAIVSADLTRDSSAIATGGLNGSGRWDLNTGQIVSFADATGDIRFSPDGKLLASIQNSGALAIFDAKTLAKLTQASIGKIALLESLDFSPDGRYIAAASSIDLSGSQNDQTVYLWEVVAGPGLTELRSVRKFVIPSLKDVSIFITSVAFSPDGKMLGVSTRYGRNSVVLLDVESGKVKSTIENETGFIDLAFSPDGKSFATASGSLVNMAKVGIGAAAKANSVQFWDVETGRELEAFGGEYQVTANKFSGFEAVTYSPDGKFLAAGAYDGTVYLRNNETKELKKFFGHNDQVHSVGFAKDESGQLLIVSGSLDSTTRIWNAVTGAEICKLTTFRDGTWAVIDPAGRYDAPNGGEIDGIQWVYGNETIALNQLKDVFYTPNLLPRLLGYNKEPLRPVPDLNSLKLFPKIVDQTVDSLTGQLTVKLQNRGGGIGEVRILINGKLAAEDARGSKLKADPTVAEALVTFDLKGNAGYDPKAKNSIEVITNNYDPQTKKGYISSRADPFMTSGNSGRPLTQPKLFAVIVGVSDYNGEQIDLKFAAKDAEDFANALGIGARRLYCPKESPDCRDKVELKLLTTSGASGTRLPTKANIKAAFAEIAAQAKPEDILVVYLAGHGASLNLDGADTYLYLTQDADKASKDALAIKEYREAATVSSNELLDWMTQEKWVAGQKGIQALKQVMILDTCASGAFEQKVSLQKTRELSSDQIRALERLKDRTGLQILMGSAADAVSYEASEYGQGILTYALLQGMKGGKLREDKYVDTQLLFGYAADEVPKIVGNLNGGIQRPRTFGSTGFDFGLLEPKDRDAIKLETIKPVFIRPRFSSGEEGDDPLDLIGNIRKKLIEMTAVRPRSDGRSIGADLVFIDDDSYSNPYRITGTYSVEGESVHVRAFIRRDGKTVSTLPEIVSRKENLGEEIITAIRLEITKIHPGK
ncbi:hypothetical protein BH10ACI2_BH10ACI2_08610 [soil metagenome]